MAAMGWVLNADCHPGHQEAMSLKAASAASGTTVPLVGQIVAQRGTVVCVAGASLSDAVDHLTLYDRTAAAIVDEEGKLVGALTENDLLLAYSAGMPSLQTSVAAWLESGRARLPDEWLPELMVPPSTSVLDAAARMRVNASEDVACRHLIVAGEGSEPLAGILSSLDLVRALCSVGTPESLQKAGAAPALEAMKPRAALPEFGEGATLAQALRGMVTSGQNCALVMAGEGGPDAEVLGLVTPRDALRAFVEHVPLQTLLGNWINGLQSQWDMRRLSADATLASAASAMAANRLHHLIVLDTQTSEVMGVLSSLDLAQAVATRAGACKGE